MDADGHHSTARVIDGHDIAGYAAGILEIIGNVPYAIAIWRREVTPSRATWAIWSLAGGLTTASYIASGAVETAWQPIAGATWNVIILALALRHGTGGVSVIDRVCFIGAIGSAVLWLVTGNAVLALTCLIAIGVIGAIPTMVSAYRHPEHEHAFAWTLWLLANLVNLAAARTWDYAIIVFPIVSAMSLAIISFFILRKRMWGYICRWRHRTTVETVIAE